MLSQNPACVKPLPEKPGIEPDKACGQPLLRNPAASPLMLK
jgi:hypothetical protein